MITKKQLQKQIDGLTSEIEKLTQIVVTDELKFLREEKKRYDEQTSLLEDVRFRVKSAKVIESDNGSLQVVVTYQLPVITLELDENGKPIEKIPFFYAVNALGMVSVEDYDKIDQALTDAQNRKRN